MCEWAVWVCQISTAFHTAPVLSTQCWGAQKQLRSPGQGTTAPTPAFSQPGSPLHRAGGQGLDQAPDTLHHSLQPATPQAMPSSWHTPWKIVGFTLFFKALFDSKTDCWEGWDVVLPWHIGNQALDGTPSCAGSWAAQSLRGGGGKSHLSSSTSLAKETNVKTASALKMYLHSPVSLPNTKYLLALRSLLWLKFLKLAHSCDTFWWTPFLRCNCMLDHFQITPGQVLLIMLRRIHCGYETRIKPPTVGSPKSTAHREQLYSHKKITKT